VGSNLVETARKIGKTRFVIEGEAVVLGVDGISDFNALHSRKHDHEVRLYAFDCLAYDGDDLSRLPLHLRKTNLAQLLRGRAEGSSWRPSSRAKLAPSCSRLRAGWGLDQCLFDVTDRQFGDRVGDTATGHQCAAGAARRNVAK